MEIRSFLELCAGNWFSQRTNFLFTQQTSENQKSELAIASLAPADATLVALCQQHHLDPNLTAGGWAVNWESSKDWDSLKQKGKAILVFIPDTSSPQSGQLLRSDMVAGKLTQPGRYQLGLDEALTLSLQEGDLVAQERIWFASENLRLRTSLLKQREHYYQTAFYSEIRKLPVPVKAA